MVEHEKYCTVIINYEKGPPPTHQELVELLEHKKEQKKVEGLEQLILHMLNGEPYPNMLMQVIRFCITSNIDYNHRVKKLLFIYLEVVEKTNPETGELKEEMILVCNALRNDLMHANEFVRGSTLRLLCKMKYYRILEPLMTPIMQNLEHRHAYVRRNAVMCIFSIVKTFGLDVMPTAVDDIENLLLVEGDISTKRNAFLMLMNCDVERAIQFCISIADSISTMGDLFQLAVLELIRKGVRASPKHKVPLLKILYHLAPSTNAISVTYDCASSLVSLTGSPMAITSAVKSYVGLLTERSDNNVKLIVLSQLQQVKKYHKDIVTTFVMDILRGLTSPSIDVRKKIVEISLSLVLPRNARDVVGLLKKEVIKTMSPEQATTEGNAEYRRLIIRALHQCTAKYQDYAQSVMFLLMDFLTESDASTASEVVMFLRELIAQFEPLRGPILQRLSETVAEIPQSRVIRGCLWLLGEYCEDAGLVANVLENLLTALKPFPIMLQMSAAANKKIDKKKPAPPEEKKEVKYYTRTIILADGTYGTEDVLEGEDDHADTQKSSPLRGVVVSGDGLLASMLGVTISKLVLKIGLKGLVGNEILYVLANMLKLSREAKNQDAVVRLAQCIRTLTAPDDVDGNTTAGLIRREWKGHATREQLNRVLEAESVFWEPIEEETIASAPPNEAICFRQLRRDGRDRTAALDFDDEGDFDAARGTHLTDAERDGTLFAERLSNVTQMSGLADTVYVEAFLQVHSFDLLLELLVVNRTNETLQNVSVEISTQGDLKLVDRPATINLAPNAQTIVHASIKVSSTETGIIFGYVSYDKPNTTEKESIVLNEIHVDVLDYIEKGWIGELSFRTMWSEFEWENKININTAITEVGAFLEHIMRNTNMSIVGRTISKESRVKTKKGPLTEEEVQEQLNQATTIKKLVNTSNFVAVNLYSKSIFGEDVLANVSIEKKNDGRLAGSVRIRARTQGIALSLGDRITIVQRGTKR
eukprot:GEMP01002223.1.p1 GENE.GEMP01002223.1~~GEMP01002223.1.p1  ORF type:complete len:987 (+),score=213.77 GEMP01002223.1:112-3072(+)